MTQEQIELLLTAKYNAQAAFDRLSKQIDKIKSGAGEANKSLSGAGASAEGAGAKLGGLAESAAAAVGPVGAMAAAVVTGEVALDAMKEAGRAAIEFISQSIDSYREEESALNKLSAAIKLHGGNVDALVPRYEALSEQVADKTLFTKEQTLDAINYFEAVGGYGPRQMDLAVKAATKLATATGKDLGVAAEYVKRYVDGDVEALRRLGVQLDATVPQTQGASAALQQIIDKFGDVDTVAAGGSRGVAAAWSTAVDNIKTDVGEGLHPVWDLLERIGTAGLKTADTMMRLSGTTGNEEKQAFALADAYLYVANAIGLVTDAEREAMAQAERTAAKQEDLQSFMQDLSAKTAALRANALKQIRAEGVPLEAFNLMKFSDATPTQIFQTLGGSAQQFLKDLSVLRSQGLVPAGSDLDRFTRYWEDLANEIVNAGQVTEQVTEIDRRTAAIRATSAQVGVDAKITALKFEEQATIAAYAKSLGMADDHGRGEEAIARLYAARVADIKVQQARAVNEQIATLYEQTHEADLRGGPAGALTDIALIEARTEAAIAAAKRQNNMTPEQLDAFSRAQRTKALRESNEIIVKESRETTETLIRDATDAERARVDVIQRGLYAKLATLDIEREAERAAVERSGKTEEDKQQLLDNIDRNYRARRETEILADERDRADEMFSIDQEIAQARIDLSGKTLGAQLANLAVEEAARARQKQLEIEADEEELARLKILLSFALATQNTIGAAFISANIAAIEQIVASDEAYLGRLDALYSLKAQKLTNLKTSLLNINEQVGIFSRGIQDAGDLFDSHLLTSIGKALDKFERMVSVLHDVTSSVRNITDIIDHMSVGGGGDNPLSQGLNLASTGKGIFDLFRGGSNALQLGEDGMYHGFLPGAGPKAGLGLGKVGSFLSNPWTIAAIGAGIGLTWLGKHLWGDAGRDAVEDFGNKNYWPGFGKGLDNMHALMAVKFGPRATDELWMEMQRVGKKDKAAAQTWEDHVIAAFKEVGIDGLQKFTEGGYAAGPTLALVGDSPGGEYMIPGRKMEDVLAQLADVRAGDTHHRWTTNIYAHDADSLRRMVRTKDGREFIKWIQESGEARLALNTALGRTS